MTDLKPLAKSLAFASFYGAGGEKLGTIGNVDFVVSPKYNARVLGSWTDYLNEIIDAPTDDQRRIRKLNMLKEDIEFNLPILQSGLDRIASGLDGVSDANRKQRMDALNNLQHQLEEAYAEWTRTLDELGITTVD